MANERFDVLVTADKNMPFQTNLKALTLAVAVLDCETNRLDDLRPLAIILMTRLGELEGGRYEWIRSDG
jgi:hypothetical protein